MDSVRRIEAGDLPGFVACVSAAFFRPVAEGYSEYLSSEIDLERTWAAFDGASVVGTLRSFATEFTVPGLRHVAAGALTNVSVAPTHRRGGLLTQMMTRELRGARERGDQVGILIASEYPIYGRFGYGVAVEGAKYAVDSGLARFRAPGIGSVERVDFAELRRHAPAIYDEFRLRQPGSIQRSDRWWDRNLHQVDVPGLEPSTAHAAIYSAPSGALEGYVRYQGKQIWDDMTPKGLLTVDELVATTPGAYRRLWQYCCEIDLLTSIEAGDRPVQEPLAYLLEDGRAVRQTSRFDFVWVRVLDVCGALESRRYAVEGRLVLEVVDALGLASGRFSLEGAPTGAHCVPSGAEPDLTVPVDALGSLYLGGVPLTLLAAAGRLEEHRSGALERADLMFHSPAPPWCSTWF